jgi:nucleotide-binding universal stress UspA family protein
LRAATSSAAIHARTLADAIGIASAPNSDMTKPLHYVQVVVAYDFSPTAELALQRAIDVACRATQHVLHVIAAIDPHHGLAIKATRHPDYLYAGQIQELLVDHVKQVLGGRASHGDVEFFVHARIGHPADQILELAREVGADLVFIGSHGLTGVERILIGSVSERVVREAHCPVMVARAKSYEDVALLHVVDDTSEHKPYKAPLRFSYVDRQSITRPNEWPIS